MKIFTAVAATALLTAISTSAAEAQTTIYGCYVKNSGTVYRIKVPGTPSKCSGNSTEFSWNMEGQVGPQGPQGPQGPAGPSGWPGVVMTSNSGFVFGGEPTDITVLCGPGQVLLTGGYYMSNPVSGTDVIGSWPYYVSDGSDSIYGWKARVRHNMGSGVGVQVIVYAYCRMVDN